MSISLNQIFVGVALTSSPRDPFLLFFFGGGGGGWLSAHQHKVNVFLSHIWFYYIYSIQGKYGHLIVPIGQPMRL